MCPDCESKFSFKKILFALVLVISGIVIFDQYATASNDKVVKNKQIIVWYSQGDSNLPSISSISNYQIT